MRLFLMRHPPPEVAEGICYGRTDLPLRAPWRANLHWPPEVRVISSPLRRCAEFAASVSPRIETDARLTELDFGAWEMRAWHEIPRVELDAWAADPLGFKAHGGESVAQMRTRVSDALAELDGRDCAWVTHAGVMKIVCGELLGLPQDEWLSLRFAYGEVIVLEQAPGKSAGNRGSLTRPR